MNIEIAKNKKRVYRKITPEVIARFQAAKIVYGSGTAAVRVLEPDETDPRRRAWLISTKCKQMNGTKFNDTVFEHLSNKAINRLGELINSSDERIATKSSQFVIDQVRGSSNQQMMDDRQIVNIETVLG